MLALILVFSLLFTAGVALARSKRTPVERAPTRPLYATTTVTHTVTVASRYWHRRFDVRSRQLMSAKVQLRRRWRPTVDYALRLASAVSGVSYYQLRSVSWCESRYDPFASNGRYHGIFQLGWSPFGFSPFDPVANALSAALTVVRDGGWRQWSCKPG